MITVILVLTIVNRNYKKATPPDPVQTLEAPINEST